MKGNDWEKVDRDEVRGRKMQPYISINNNRIRLNESASRYFHENTDKAVLYLNESGPKLAIEGNDGTDKDAVNFIITEDGKARYINSKKFTHRLRTITGKPDKDTLKFPAEWNREEQMLIADLRKEL